MGGIYIEGMNEGSRMEGGRGGGAAGGYVEWGVTHGPSRAISEW